MGSPLNKAPRAGLRIIGVDFIQPFPIQQKIRSLIASDKTREIDAVRLVMLYALRYERHNSNDINGLIDALSRRGVSEKMRKVGASSCYLF